MAWSMTQLWDLGWVMQHTKLILCDNKRKSPKALKLEMQLILLYLLVRDKFLKIMQVMQKQKYIPSATCMGPSLYGTVSVIQYETPYTNVVYCIKIKGRKYNIISSMIIFNIVEFLVYAPLICNLCCQQR